MSCYVRVCMFRPCVVILGQFMSGNFGLAQLRIC